MCLERDCAETVPVVPHPLYSQVLNVLHSKPIVGFTVPQQRRWACCISAFVCFHEVMKNSSDHHHVSRASHMTFRWLALNLYDCSPFLESLNLSQAGTSSTQSAKPLWAIMGLTPLPVKALVYWSLHLGFGGEITGVQSVSQGGVFEYSLVPGGLIGLWDGCAVEPLWWDILQGCSVT